MTKEIEIVDFAERVERLCDFFLAKHKRDGSNDLKIIQNLKEEAADIHFGRVRVVTEGSLDGLYDYMNGV